MPRILLAFRNFTLAWEDYVRELADLLRISLNEGMALSYLTIHGAVSAKDLGTALHFTSGATTTLVDRLAERDLVERRAHPTDRRVSLVALTANAEHQLAEGRAWLAAAVLEVPEERKDETVRVLEDLSVILASLSDRLSSTKHESL